MPNEGRVLQLDGGLELRLHPNVLEVWSQNVFLCGFTPEEWRLVSRWVPAQVDEIAKEMYPGASL